MKSHVKDFSLFYQIHSVLKEVRANNQEPVPAAIASPENKDAAKDIISNLQANGGKSIRNIEIIREDLLIRYCVSSYYKSKTLTIIAKTVKKVV